jgi:predicted CxxxxCH...CXXCH cytochrome family protein
VSPAGCTYCHGASPADGNHPSGSGAGLKHGQYYGTDTASCVKCHPSHTTEAKPFQHASSASQRSLILTFTAAPNNGAGTPAYSKTANLAYPAYLPSQTSAANRNGTCTNMYCHSDGRSLAATLTTNATATWGGALSCAGCHKADGVAAVAIATDKHAIHVASDTGYNYSCVKCHSTTASNSTTISNLANHVNQSVNVAFNNTTTAVNGKYNNVASPMSKAVNGAKGYCSNVYCHSDGTKISGTFTALSSAKWDGTLPTNCTGCHGGDAAVATNRQITTGKHAQHVNNTSYAGTTVILACGECHGRTVGVASNRLVTDKTRHANRFVEYSGAKAARASMDASKNCTTSYCHSNGKAVYKSVSWTAASSALSCTGCHDNGTLSHPKHVTTNGIGCEKCHNNTAASTVALKSGTTTHINGTYNLNGTDLRFAAFSSSWKASYSAGGKTCSTIYCHSNGRGGYMMTPVWGASSNCSTCHPLNALSAGHGKHIDVVNTGIFYTYTANRSDVTGYKFGCSTCHPADEATYHGNGYIDITLKPTTGTFASGSLRSRNVNVTTEYVNGINVPATSGIAVASDLTCTNVYCHTNGYATSTNWTNVTPGWRTGSFSGDRCAACHGNSPNVGIAGSPAHAAHVVGIHYDDIFNGTGGKIAVSTAATTPHGNAATSTTISCNICHYATITTSDNNANTVCKTCHTAGGGGTGASLRSPATIAGFGFHVNGRVDVVFPTASPISVKSKAQIRDASFSLYSAAGGYWTRINGYKLANGSSFDQAKANSAAWGYTAGGTCSNIACHNLDATRSVNWTTDNGKAAQCSMCHTNL